MRNDKTRSGSEKRAKELTFGVRCSPEEKAALKAKADAFGISMGALCRSIIFGAKPKSKTDQNAIAELAAARADLGRLGGLLKGWLSGAFDKPAPAIQTRDEVVALLRQIEATQALISVAATKVVA